MRVVSMLLMGMLIVLIGCSSKRLEMDMTSQPVFYINQFVEKSPLQMYVHPTGPPEVPPTALFIPFRVIQEISDATIIGENISQQVWQAWLQQVVFPVIEWSPMQVPYREDMALALGRVRGADYVVGGVITYIVDGGMVGDSYFSVKIDIHEVLTGNLMWSMAQSGMMRQKDMEDYIFFAVERRMPIDPLAAIVQSIAADMGQKIREMNVPAPRVYPDGESF